MGAKEGIPEKPQLPKFQTPILQVLKHNATIYTQAFFRQRTSLGHMTKQSFSLDQGEIHLPVSSTIFLKDQGGLCLRSTQKMWESPRKAHQLSQIPPIKLIYA